MGLLLIVIHIPKEKSRMEAINLKPSYTTIRDKRRFYGPGIRLMNSSGNYEFGLHLNPERNIDVANGMDTPIPEKRSRRKLR